MRYSGSSAMWDWWEQHNACVNCDEPPYQGHCFCQPCLKKWQKDRNENHITPWQWANEQEVKRHKMKNHYEHLGDIYDFSQDTHKCVVCNSEDRPAGNIYCHKHYAEWGEWSAKNGNSILEFTNYKISEFNEKNEDYHDYYDDEDEAFKLSRNTDGPGITDHIYITKFAGGKDGACLQITIGDKYAQFTKKEVEQFIEILEGKMFYDT